MKNKISVLIADDHPIFRRGLEGVIRLAPGIKVLNQASDGTAALQTIEESGPDIAVLDVNMPGMSGMDIAKAVRDKDLSAGIVFLTMYKEEDIFNEAMDLGVMGYVLKENAVTEIVNAIRSVAQGEYYISPSISGYLVKRKKRADELKKENPGLESLTPAETQILKLIAKGNTSKEIAAELHVSTKTIENHRAHISQKLHIHGAHSLLRFAVENKSRL